MPQIERYMAKISGPLLDRIDLHLEVPAVPFRELSATSSGIRERAVRGPGEGNNVVGRRPS